jgi:hypothetical protein
VRCTAVALLLVTGTAHADPWYSDKRRVTHVGITVVGAIGYLLSETTFKADLAPSTCHWCVPPGFDASVRNALKWGNTSRAAQLSSLTGYVLTPTLGFGMVALTSINLPDRSYARFLDDTVPILETITITEGVDQIVKFTVGRARPFVHFTNAPPDIDNNLSFFSGHTTLVFGVTVSAGMVAHARGYAVEPYIWAIGLPLAAATGYLRIAADEHYLSDVLVGMAVGASAGFAIPELTMRRVVVSPTPNGIAVAGEW